MILEKDEDLELGTTLQDWVMKKAEDWDNHYTQNYRKLHQEYARLWRGIWNPEDKTKDSERSRLIAPALQQAVESNVAEIEEATFGRGKWFDIADDVVDQDKSDAASIRVLLQEDFERTKVKKAISEIVLSSAVYGTGIGEIVLEQVKEMKPATRPILDGAMQSVGVEIQDRVVVKLRPVLPQNFKIDPAASTIEDSVGVIIDEFVPRHQVEQGILDGIYLDVDLDDAPRDDDLEYDRTLTVTDTDRVRLTKYYGLIPRKMLSNDVLEESDADIADILTEETTEDSEGYVEAIVVIANESHILKVEENPYMMQDRPVVAFQWDTVPNVFWGRGVCEKGYNSQKALDAELRARMDALALTVHPMMAVDATRLSRGAKLEIKAGKTILTNGNPSEVLMPFKFGAVDQVTFAQGAELQRMVQQATGANDATGVTGGVNGEATAAGISMSLGAIIKRHKRTLINFHESFLLPFVEKAAWRYMQFDPERYQARDYKFIASSTLGIVAREYEVSQLVQLLNTTPPDSPAYPLLVKSVITNMNISNREEIIAALDQASQPNPEQQAMMQQQQQMQAQMMQLEMALKQAQVQREQAEAQLAMVKAQVEPQLAQAKFVAAISNNLNEDNESADFEKRMAMTDRMLKARDLDIKERAMQNQMIMARENNQQRGTE